MDYVAHNVAICHSCGYNLRGHGVICVCPECGTHHDFDAMREEAIGFVKRRRFLALGPIAILRKRPTAWWWAFEDGINYSIRAACANFILAILITVISALTMGSLYIRTEAEFFAHYPGGITIQIFKDEYARGPFGSFENYLSNVVTEYSKRPPIPPTRVEFVYESEIEFVGASRSLQHSMLILVLWSIPALCVPMTMGLVTIKRLSGDHQQRIHRSVVAAFLYESSRIAHLQIAVWLTWPVLMVCYWLDPGVTYTGYVVLFEGIACVGFNVVAWVQALRSDRAGVLHLSPAGIALFSIGYGAVLPCLICIAARTFYELWIVY